MNKHSISIALTVLLSSMPCTPLYAASDIHDTATPETISTQLITNDARIAPYMVTGESLVHLVSTMADFDIAGASASFNRATGQLIVKNTPDNLAQVEDVLQSLRAAASRQIEIEARIITVATDDIDALGLEALDSDNTLSFHKNKKGFLSFGEDGNSEISFPDVTNRDKTGSLGQEFALGFGNSRFNIGVFIDALKSKADVNTVAAPRLTVFNNQRGHIKVSTIQDFVSEVDTNVQLSGTGQDASIYFETEIFVRQAPSGTTLDVTPTINSDGTITLSLHPVYLRADLSKTTTIESVVDGSRQANNSLALPVFVQQAVDTTVVVPDGGTAIIGGLIDETETKSRHKIPILSTIPLIGNLFKNKNDRTERSYLIMFIKATSVTPGSK